MAKNAQEALRATDQSREGNTATEVAPAPTTHGSVAPAPHMAGGAIVARPAGDMAPKRSRARLLPSGGMLIELLIEPEEAELLKTWAEQAGTPLELYVQEQVTEALRAYCSAQGV